jgi:hypothetical protein
MLFKTHYYFRAKPDKTHATGLLTLHQGLMVTSVTEGGTQKLPKKFKIVETIPT